MFEKCTGKAIKESKNQRTGGKPRLDKINGMLKTRYNESKQIKIVEKVFKEVKILNTEQ